MANPIKLLFKSKKYKVGSIELDLIINENHSFSNQISEHDIEDGSVLTDHIKNNLFAGAITAYITNFTIDRSVAFGDFLANRAQEAFDALEELWRERTPVTIITQYKVYEDVAIVDINIPNDESLGSALYVTLTFREMNIVQLKTVDVDVSIKQKDMKTKQKRQAAKTVDKGSTTPEFKHPEFAPADPISNITIETDKTGR
ncbi:MAG: phage baseplate protein [Candidatus Hodarchaeales archaeon]|jgi:hypothetical protein